MPHGLHGPSVVQVPSMPSFGTQPASVATAASPAEGQTRLEAIHKLQAIFEAQNSLFMKTWEDMKDQVYTALLHRDGQQVSQATRPNTPTSTYSACSSRTPAPGSTGTAHTAYVIGALPASAADNPREVTLQMWSSLGSTLREVVNRNLTLEEENKRLRQDLQRLQQNITDVQQALAHHAAGPSERRQ